MASCSPTSSAWRDVRSTEPLHSSTCCSCQRLRRCVAIAGGANPIAGDETSRSEPLQRRTEACTRLLGLLPALALLLDHLFRGTRHEVGIAELGVDLAHLVGELPDLLLQPHAFGL